MKERVLEEDKDSELEKLQYDKFGNKRCLVMEKLKEEMVIPKEDATKGKVTLNEEKIYEKLRKLNGGTVPTDARGEVIGIDSLMGSAFNSDENKKWERYKFKVAQPQASEISDEKFLLFDPDQSLDELESIDFSRDIDQDAFDIREERMLRQQRLAERKKVIEEQDLDQF